MIPLFVVCLSVGMCVGCMHLNVCICRSQMRLSGLFLCHSLLHFLQTVFVIDSEDHCFRLADRLVSSQDPPVFTSQCWGYKYIIAIDTFYEFWGFKLRPSDAYTGNIVPTKPSPQHYFCFHLRYDLM